MFSLQFKWSSRRERLLGLEIGRTVSLEVECPEVGLEGEHIMDGGEEGRWISICKYVHTHRLLLLMHLNLKLTFTCLPLWFPW